MQLRVNEPRAPSYDEAQVICPVESYRGALPGWVPRMRRLRKAPERNALTTRFESMPFASECKSVIVATARNSRGGEIVAQNFFPHFALLEARGPNDHCARPNTRAKNWPMSRFDFSRVAGSAPIA